MLWKRRDVVNLMRKLESDICPANCKRMQATSVQSCIYKVNIMVSCITKVKRQILQHMTSKQGLTFLAVCIGSIIYAFINSVRSRLISDDPEDWLFQTVQIYGFGTDRSPYYEIMIVYELIATIIIITSHMGSLIIVVGSMMLITGHYSNLSCYIEDLARTSRWATLVSMISFKKTLKLLGSSVKINNY